jgi:chitodextrinase
MIRGRESFMSSSPLGVRGGREKGRPQASWTLVRHAPAMVGTYSEILPDETKETATAFWHRAHAWLTAAGITVERVMTDNGSCYVPHAWRNVLAAAGSPTSASAPTGPPLSG